MEPQNQWIRDTYALQGAARTQEPLVRIGQGDYERRIDGADVYPPGSSPLPLINPSFSQGSRRRRPGGVLLTFLRLVGVLAGVAIGAVLLLLLGPCLPARRRGLNRRPPAALSWRWAAFFGFLAGAVAVLGGMVILAARMK